MAQELPLAQSNIDFIDACDKSDPVLAEACQRLADCMIGQNELIKVYRHNVASIQAQLTALDQSLKSSVIT